MTLIHFFSFLLGTSLLLPFCLCQAQNVWIGGFPGHKTDWHFAFNWSMHQVPDEWDDVYIPNTSTTTFAYPIIDTDAGTINSINMGFGAYITITENGDLVIKSTEYSNGDIRQWQAYPPKMPSALSDK